MPSGAGDLQGGHWLASNQAFDGVVELAHLFGAVARLDGVGYAVFGVIGQELEGHAFKGRLDRTDLSQHIDAVTILLNHLLQPPHLPLDPAETHLYDSV